MYSKLRQASKHNTNSYEIVFGGFRKALSVLNVLYNDATIYLDRKYERYLDMLNVQNSRLQQ